MPFLRHGTLEEKKRKFIVADSFADFVCKGENVILIQLIFGLDLLIAVDEYWRICFSLFCSLLFSVLDIDWREEKAWDRRKANRKSPHGWWWNENRRWRKLWSPRFGVAKICCPIHCTNWGLAGFCLGRLKTIPRGVLGGWPPREA